MLKLILTAEALRMEIGAPTIDTATSPCTCAMVSCAGWESCPEEQWPAAHMQRLATLRDPSLDDPTFEEYHPAGSRYDSPQAPIAVSFFPYNRCDLWRCTGCQRYVLRYTEFGGYYVDHRVRAIDPNLIAD